MIVPIVIHVVVSLDHGGLERLVVDWTNERNRRHHAVSLTSSGWTSICCLDKPGDLAGEVNGDVVVCVNAKRGRKPFDIAAVLRLRLLIRGRKTEDGGPGAETRDLESSQEGLRSTVYGLWSAPIVVHSHNLAAWQYAALACVGTGVRHIHTEHGTNPHYRGMVNQIRNRLLSTATDAIVAVSADTADSLIENQHIPREQIYIIPNGVVGGGSPAGSSSKMRAILGLPGNVPVVGSIGRLAEVKGQDRLLRAFAALRARMDCRLLLVGDGPSRASLEGLAADLGVAQDIAFSGFRGDARDCLSAMDLFVLPSRSEGLPVALLEAMSGGIPVAATPVGEVSDVLENGAVGCILPDDESLWPDVLADELARSAGAREVRAQQRVVECYSQDKTLASYEDLYCSILQ